MNFETEMINDFIERFSVNELKLNVTTVVKFEDQSGSKVIEAPQKAADVFSVTSADINSMVAKNKVADVNAFYSNFVKTENHARVLDDCTVNNSVYAFPKSYVNGMYLFYDKRYLNENDIQSMDAMIEKARQAGKNVYFCLGNAWYSTGIFLAAGCDIRNENGKQTANLNSPEGLAAAKAMCHLAKNIDNGFIASCGTMGDIKFVSQGFEQGVLAAAILSMEGYADIKSAVGDENLGVAKLPTIFMDGEQKQLYSLDCNRVVAVNAYSKAPFTAQTLAYFLCSRGVQEKRYLELGVPPSNLNVIKQYGLESSELFLAIQEQNPYTAKQHEVVGEKYWGMGVDSMGWIIAQNKGELTDEELVNLLKGGVY